MNRAAGNAVNDCLSFMVGSFLMTDSASLCVETDVAQQASHEGRLTLPGRASRSQCATVSKLQ
jgi:hypothetical protein